MVHSDRTVLPEVDSPRYIEARGLPSSPGPARKVSFRKGPPGALMREDGLETDVFSLIGLKLFDIPGRELEGAGWIALTGVYFCAAAWSFFISSSPRARLKTAKPAMSPMSASRSFPPMTRREPTVKSEGAIFVVACLAAS